MAQPKHIGTIKATFADKVFDIINHIVLIIAAFLVLYPMYIILIASISDPAAVTRGDVLFYPIDISFIGYTKLLEYKQLWISYWNTIVYTLFGTLLNVIVTMMTAYALSRKFPGKRVVNFYFVVPMFFSGGLIPTFIAVQSYGLYNNPLIMVIMGTITIWNVMIAKTFIGANLPNELYEAASIDGCSHFRFFAKMVMPLSKALIAVLVVYYAVGHWNDFMTGLIYLQNRKLLPLQVILRELVASLKMTDAVMEMTNNLTDTTEIMRIAESVKYSSIIIATAPIIALYMVMQKHFQKGLMSGSIKG